MIQYIEHRSNDVFHQVSSINFLLMIDRFLFKFYFIFPFSGIFDDLFSQHRRFTLKMRNTKRPFLH